MEKAEDWKFCWPEYAMGMCVATPMSSSLHLYKWLHIWGLHVFPRTMKCYRDLAGAPQWNYVGFEGPDFVTRFSHILASALKISSCMETLTII